MAILPSDKVHFRIQKITTNSKGTLEGSIHPEVIAVINVYAPNNKATKYEKEKLIKLKGEINKQLWDAFNIPSQQLVDLDRK